MLNSYLHSSNNKRAESLDSWEPVMVITSLRCIYSVTNKDHASKSLEWVGQPTLRTRHSWVAWVDAKESRRLRTWASASLKSRKKVAKKSQSKHPFRHHQGCLLCTACFFVTTETCNDPDDVLKTKTFGHSSFYYPPIFLCFISGKIFFITSHIHIYIYNI